MALFVALGGGAYAATQLPKNSVGTTQIKNNAVTPAKLSQAAESGLEGPRGPAGAKGATGATGVTGPKGVTGSAGPKGDTGDRGPEGPRGLEGQQGVEGPEGDLGPLVVDAVVKNFQITNSTTAVQLPLTGTTEWTPGPGQVGVVSAQMTGKAAVNGSGSSEQCLVAVGLRANGHGVGNTMSLFTSFTEPTVFQQTLSNSGAQAIGLVEPAGTPQVITAVLSAMNPANAACKTGTEIEELRIIVAPQG
jgi:hypothetical protein